MPKQPQYATHLETGAPCAILSSNSVHHQVYWLESDGFSDVPVTDVQLVDVPLQHPSVIRHNVTQEQIEILEDQFSYLTEDGWIIPDWIHLLR